MLPLSECRYIYCEIGFSQAHKSLVTDLESVCLHFKAHETQARQQVEAANCFGYLATELRIPVLILGCRNPECAQLAGLCIR